MTRKIKFIVHAVRWFDKKNGNTCHSVKITRLKDDFIICKQMQYGYGDHYRQTAIKLMADCKWLPVKYRKDAEHYKYERENNYPIIWEVIDGLKRDCIANGSYQ